MDKNDVQHYQWLTSATADAQLTLLAQPTPVSPGQFAKLREQFGQTRAEILVTQSKLRKRSLDKFSVGGEMFFTEIGLQQATDKAIASFKANQIKQLFPQVRHVTDLCCGIGGDLMALAQHFDVTGVDADPVVAWLAGYNAALENPRGTVIIQQQDVNKTALESTDWIHLDPDRRADGQRHTSIDGYQPSAGFMNSLLQARDLSHRGLSIKLAPATKIPENWLPSMTSRQWIQSRGECRQQLVTFASGNRSVQAIGVNGNGQSEWKIGFAVDNIRESHEVPLATECEEYLYEPEPAVLAARLDASWALEHQLSAIRYRIAYYTSSNSMTRPGSRRFRVVECLPFDRKKIKGWLRQRNVGRLEIKKRGITLSPERLRKELQLRGNNEMSLIIIGNLDTHQKAIAILAKRE